MNEQTDRERADEARKAGNYDAVVDLCWPTWSDSATRDLDLGWTLAFSLRKTGHHGRALDVARDLWRSGRRDHWVAGEYARAIYNAHIKGAESYDGSLLKAVLAIRDLLKDDQGDPKYSPLPAAALAVAKLTKDQPALALEVLGVLEPAMLSIEPGRMTDADGRSRTFPSDLERYWLARTRALKGAGQWHDLLAAIDQVPTDHISPGGAGWLVQREATAHRQLGEPQRGLDRLHTLRATHHEWWLMLAIAECNVALGRPEAAFPDVVTALSLPGPGIEHRISAVELMAKLSVGHEDPELARDHLALAIAVRSEAGWPIKDDLRRFAEELGADATISNSRDLVKRLRKTWQRLSNEADPPLEGMVGKLLLGDDAVAHSGFIRDSDGEECFFRVSDVVGAPVTTNDSVSFRRQRAFDKKKNRESWRATEIRRVE